MLSPFVRKVLKVVPGGVSFSRMPKDGLLDRPSATVVKKRRRGLQSKSVRRCCLQWVVDGGWNIADCVERSYDLEAMEVGTVAAGRIGLAVLRRLKPFDVKLHYTDRHRLPDSVEKELNLTFHANAESMVKVCDVVTINAPLHPATENLFNAALLANMRRGAYLINTARGKIANRDDVVSALKTGQLAGYAGDVWFPQPAPKDHPWRTMPHHGMTPHISGSSLSAQARYAAGTR
jgi:formate dehydrogenase